MMKKVIAALLALTLLLSCLSVTVFAADDENTMIWRNDIAGKVAQIFAERIGKPGAQITVDECLINTLKSGSIFYVRAGDLADKLAHYALVEADTLSEEEKTSYGSCKVHVLADGVETVYIVVDIAAHPDLFQLDCFHDAVTELVEKQEDLAVTGVTLMDYNRVAGELALHMLVYGVTAPIVGIQKERTPSVIRQLYDEAAIAEINIDENRVPTILMNVIGGITDVLYKMTFGLFR